MGLRKRLGSSSNACRTRRLWTPSGLTTPQCITTDGTHVWIIDSGSDKVFKYDNAASRLTGSQAANSSFALNNGNKNSTDLVTNGTSIWTLEGANIDKVFKYSVAGALVGSWTISATNSTPSGLTIDPANVSNIWIVDSGTDKVYQYSGATTRTSDSQAFATSFSLAAGNTNAQGIADPPAPSDGVEIADGNVDIPADVEHNFAPPNTTLGAVSKTRSDALLDVARWQVSPLAPASDVGVEGDSGRDASATPSLSDAWERATDAASEATWTLFGDESWLMYRKASFDSPRR